MKKRSSHLAADSTEHACRAVRSTAVRLLVSTKNSDWLTSTSDGLSLGMRTQPTAGASELYCIRKLAATAANCRARPSRSLDITMYSTATAVIETASMKVRTVRRGPLHSTICHRRLFSFLLQSFYFRFVFTFRFSVFPGIEYEPKYTVFIIFFFLFFVPQIQTRFSVVRPSTRVRTPRLYWSPVTVAHYCAVHERYDRLRLLRWWRRRHHELLVSRARFPYRFDMPSL